MSKLGKLLPPFARCCSLSAVWMQREIQREQQRVRELEMSSERQKRILRAKIDEMSVMQRRLRSAGLPVTTTQDAYVGICCSY